MGSISSPSRSSHPPHENSYDDYRVYASFCGRDSIPNINMSNWLECYNPSNNSWHRVSTIPGLIENHVLKGFAMVSVVDSIYVIGGRLCRKVVEREPYNIAEIDIVVLPSVLRYNICTNLWSKCAPLGIPRFDFACTVSENKIYVAGGKSKLTGARGISSAEVYDPSLDEWKPLPNMSTMRYKCVGVTWHGKIHVVGGFTDGGDCDSPGPYNTRRSSAEVYNTGRDTWDFVARMWELDVPPNQIVAVDGRLFSSGDCLNAWKGHIEAYDGKLNIWNVVDGSHLHTLSSPISTSGVPENNEPSIQRLYLTMAPIGTHLYYLAGYQTTGQISRWRSEVHVFDTSANGNGWRSFEPTEEEREKELCCHCCALREVQ